jgi:hypothetical protein
MFAKYEFEALFNNCDPLSLDRSWILIGPAVFPEFCFLILASDAHRCESDSSLVGKVLQAETSYYGACISMTHQQ